MGGTMGTDWIVPLVGVGARKLPHLYWQVDEWGYVDGEREMVLYLLATPCGWARIGVTDDLRERRTTIRNHTCCAVALVAAWPMGPLAEYSDKTTAEKAAERAAAETVEGLLEQAFAHRRRPSGRRTSWYRFETWEELMRYEGLIEMSCDLWWSVSVSDREAAIRGALRELARRELP